MSAYSTFPLAKYRPPPPRLREGAVEYKRFHFPCPAVALAKAGLFGIPLQAEEKNKKRNLSVGTSYFPPCEVSSDTDAFTSLFGMGRGRAHPYKAPTLKFLFSLNLRPPIRVCLRPVGVSLRAPAGALKSVLGWLEESASLKNQRFLRIYRNVEMSTYRYILSKSSGL